MRIKRLIAGLLASVMVFSTVACSGSSTPSNGTAAGGTDSARQEETVTLTVYSQLANFSGEQVGWFAKVLLDKFNVKLTIIPDYDGVYDTRMANGNLGDIVVWGNDGNDYLKAVEAGMLLDWEEDDLLTEYGPYIKENLSRALEKNRNITPEIGKIFGFGHGVSPSSDSFEEFFYTWDMRWDLYEQLGHPQVKDWDGMISLFEQMQAICPTDELGNPTYAMSLWPDWDGSMVMYVKAMATAYYGYDEQGLGLYDPSTGNYHDALEEGGPYLTSLKFFNTLYQKGLLDPNSMTQLYDDAVSKIRNGGVFFSIFNYAGSLAYNSDEHIAQNKYMTTLIPDEAVPLTYGMSVYGGNRIWTIGSKTQYPELCMEIINWLATPEGRMISEYGPKGLTWDYDENGNAYLTEFGELCKADGKNTQMTGDYAGYTFADGQQQINNITWSINALNPDSNGDTYNYETWKTRIKPAKCETEQDWRDYTGCDTTMDYIKTRNFLVAPATTYSEAKKTDEFDVMWNQVTNQIVTSSWNAIYAKSDREFEYLVKDMVTKAKAYGYDEVIAWCQEEAAKRHELEEATRK